MADDQNRHRFQKDKDGFKIDSTDPVQDEMSEEELDEANQRLQDLINSDSED